MAAKKQFAQGATINVSVPSKMTLEQTNQVTAAILHHTGCPTCYSGYKFNFIEEEELVIAQVNERGAFVS